MRITMTDWIHRVLDEYIKEGDCCIDATMGKGGDTYYLCSKTGKTLEKSTPLMCRQMH